MLEYSDRPYSFSSNYKLLIAGWWLGFLSIGVFTYFGGDCQIILWILFFDVLLACASGMIWHQFELAFGVISGLLSGLFLLFVIFLWLLSQMR